MKTVEVLERVVKGKRVAEITKRHYREALGSLAEYSPEWPESGVVINEWLAQLDRYADTTVKMWFTFVNAAGRYMQKASGRRPNGSFKFANPCDDAERPSVEKKRRRYFSEDEMVAVIQACMTDYEKALILTLIDSTCRIGELGEAPESPPLLGRGVDLQGFINVKGKTGERRYRLEVVVCRALKAMAGGDDSPVFKSQSGEACTVSGLKHRVRRVIARAGITGEKCGAHTLRHSGASLLARETGSALVVKALLQHDDIKTSMKYIHDVEETMQQKHSPLKTLGEAWFRQHADEGAAVSQQLTMEASADAFGSGLSDVVADDMVEGEFELAEDIVDGLFVEIPDGVSVRPLLKTEDLRRLREIFLRSAGSGNGGHLNYWSREWLKRILRYQK